MIPTSLLREYLAILQQTNTGSYGTQLRALWVWHFGNLANYPDGNNEEAINQLCAQRLTWDDLCGKQLRAICKQRIPDFQLHGARNDEMVTALKAEARRVSDCLTHAPANIGTLYRFSI